MIFIAETNRDYIKCTRCGGKYAVRERQFYSSKSPIYINNDNKLPVCKACVDEMFGQYKKNLKSEKDAARRICMKFDIYYNERICEMVENQKTYTSYIGAYITRSNLNPFSGKTYDTTIEEEDNELISSTRAKNIRNSASKKKAIAEWGFFDPQDYQFLDLQYEDWKSRVVIDSKSREDSVRQMCVNKLMQNKMLKAGDISSYDKLCNTYERIRGVANLQPKQEDSAEKDAEMPLGQMIERFENERPIPEPSPEWKDVDGVIKLITVYFIGHLCKMLGLKNRYSAMYEEEMDKYRADAPELAEAEEEYIFEFLLNKSESQDDSDGEEDGN